MLTLLLQLHSVTHIIHITMLLHTHFCLLPAYCFSCTFLASRSMIAQVSTFVVKPLENHTFWTDRGPPIGPLLGPLGRSSGASLGESPGASPGTLRGSSGQLFGDFSGVVFGSHGVLWALDLSAFWKPVARAAGSRAERGSAQRMKLYLFDARRQGKSRKRGPGDLQSAYLLSRSAKRCFV